MQYDIGKMLARVNGVGERGRTRSVSPKMFLINIFLSKMLGFEFLYHGIV